MACLPSIAAALRACMPCPASPPARRWIQADQISVDRAAPGKRVDVRLNSVDARDNLGRIAHVRGIYIFAEGQFTLGQANDAVSAYQLRSLISAMVLQDVTSHFYWPSIDGRDILDDTFFRHWANINVPSLKTGVQSDPATQFQALATVDHGIPANAGAGAFSAPLTLYCPLVTLGPGMNPLAGLIPLAALQRQSNQGSFRFNLLTQIAGFAGPPAGVTFDGVEDEDGEAGMSVWLDVVYLPALAIDPAWMLDRYPLSEVKNGVLRSPESSTEFAVVRFKPEDDAVGASAANFIDQITLTVAGQVEIPGFTTKEAVLRGLLFAQERDSATTRYNAAQDLPMLDGATGDAQQLVLLPYRQRGMGEAAGDIAYRFGQIGQLSQIPFLHRTVSCQEEGRAGALAQAVGCDPCSRTVATDSKGNPASIGKSKGTLLVLDPAANGK